MIDLHLHLLPGVDDGSPDLDTTRRMLGRARGLGFERLIATPHLPAPLTPSYAASVRSALDDTRPLASALGIALGLGFEVPLVPDLPARLTSGEPVTLARSKTVLVDLPFVGWPTYVEDVLFDLQAAGFRPLLAHPERYPDVQRDPARAARLAARGVLLQVTTGSLTGLFGRRAQAAAEALLCAGAVHVLATDAHSAGHRFVSVEEGLRHAEALVGPEGVARLVHDNPAALLADEPLPAPPPLPESGCGRSRSGLLRRAGEVLSRVR